MHFRGQAIMSVIKDSLVHIVLFTASIYAILLLTKNSIEWQAKRMWGAPDNMWEVLWQRVIDFFGDNEALLFTVGTTLFAATVFWLYNSIFIFMDLTGQPAFVRKYKIQEKKNSPLTWKQLKSVLDVVLPGQALALPVTLAFYPIQKWRGIQYAASELPTLQTLVFHVALIIFLQAFIFHYVHKLLHHPFLYKRIHKVHHEWTAPISLTAVYAHPIEAVISNFVPLVLAPTLVGCHLATSWIWYVEAIIQTANDHSGYHFPFMPSPQFHDYHHLKFTQCYGVFGILDHLHGTDRQFLSSTEYKRHRMFFGFTPFSRSISEEPVVCNGTKND